jgi:hypothetical protein
MKHGGLRQGENYPQITQMVQINAVAIATS